MAHTFVSGDLVSLHDTRDARRVCTVKWVTDAGVGAEFIDTTYVATGTRLIAPDGSETLVGLLEALEQSIVLHAGDVLTVTSDLTPVDHVIYASVVLSRTPWHRLGLVIECSSTTARSWSRRHFARWRD